MMPPRPIIQTMQYNLKKSIFIFVGWGVKR